MELDLKEITEYLVSNIEKSCNHLLVMSKPKFKSTNHYDFIVESYISPTKKGTYKIECYILDHNKDDTTFVINVDESKFIGGDFEENAYFSYQLNDNTTKEDIFKFIDGLITNYPFFESDGFFKILEKRKEYLLKRLSNSFKDLRWLDKEDYYPLIDSLSPFIDNKQIKYLMEYTRFVKSKEDYIIYLEKQLVEKENNNLKKD
ncbi:hypothetical protein [Campylobacter sp. CCS1377]|uniref:Uncharacterized protein n=1 Tax=Campylobacter sp. CCS1377 TaxID=3158229 RepID=A0AAU7E6D8_9BACT